MDSFVKRSTPSSSSKAAHKGRKEQSDFLTVASRKFEQSNTDVGVDIIGDLKGNLDNVVDYFKLVKEFDSIKGEIQQFQFTTPFPAKKYRLIEVSSSMLNAFENGEKFAFRGDPDDNVVLCTGSKTYEVKETETSNTFLMAPKLSVGSEVCAGVPILSAREILSMNRHYLELKELSFVSKAKLREIMKKDELTDCLSDTCGKRWTLEALLESVQMSESELLETVKHWPVIRFNGCYRWLSLELRRELLDAAVEAIDDQCLAIDRSITFEILRAALSDRLKYPDVLIDWLLSTHFEVVESDDASTPHYLASHRPFCRTRARQLLPLAKNYLLDQFIQNIEKIVPIGVLFKLEYLDGVALTSKSITQGERIEYFSADDLPEPPRERLGVLFSTRPSWTLDQIAPFVKCIVPRGTTIQSFLHIHCRAETTSSGAKIYCALKPL